MRRSFRVVAVIVVLSLLLVLTPGPAASKVGQAALAECAELAFSTEEDFVTQGPEPADGNPIISDGDLLSPNGVVCARNADLLEASFDVFADLGLDAADVLDVENYLVALSTELDSPNAGQFTAGDLLITNGAIILNQALTAPWQVGYDIGLDAVHFVGEAAEIQGFLDEAAGLGEPVGPDALAALFDAYNVDIWFSTEGTLGPLENPTFLDGDLLSARNGTIVAGNADLLAPGVPAGIPNDGVDFGLDAATADRGGTLEQLHYSTEILYQNEISFTDGDVLLYANGVAATNGALVTPFEPQVMMLGLDALSVNLPDGQPCVNRVTKIGGVDVADIDPATGMVYPLALGLIDAPKPFGGKLTIEGTLCDDVDRFRVVYREAGSSDPWEPLDVSPAKGWQVSVDAFIPVGPDCLGDAGWSSTTDGWFDATSYRQLTTPALGGCNPGLALTVWESGSAVAGKDELYELVLEADTTSGVVSDTLRLVQLDNTGPDAELEKMPGTCDIYSEADMPLMVTGRITDTHFHQYRLTITGNGYGTYSYPATAYYDDPFDNIIDTGTSSYDAFVNLHTVDVDDLATDPVDCGYTVIMRAWDRTIARNFNYSANHAGGCVGCRNDTDYWTFEYNSSP